MTEFTEPTAIGSAYGVSPIVVKCLTCHALLMPEDRDAHADWHDDETQRLARALAKRKRDRGQ